MTAFARHPLDPDPVRSSLASAVLGLAILGLVLVPLAAGWVPGLVAWALAGPARATIDASDGFLTGGRAVRVGTVLAIVAVVASLAVGVGLTSWWIAEWGLLDRGPVYGDDTD